MARDAPTIPGGTRRSIRLPCIHELACGHTRKHGGRHICRCHHGLAEGCGSTAAGSASQRCVLSAPRLFSRLCASAVHRHGDCTGGVLHADRATASGVRRGGVRQWPLKYVAILLCSTGQRLTACRWSDEFRFSFLISFLFAGAACRRWPGPLQRKLLYIFVFKMNGLADGGGGIVCGCTAVDGLVLCVNLLHALEAALDSVYLAVSPVYCPL